MSGQCTGIHEPEEETHIDDVVAAPLQNTTEADAKLPRACRSYDTCKSMQAAVLVVSDGQTIVLNLLNMAHSKIVSAILSSEQRCMMIITFERRRC